MPGAEYGWEGHTAYRARAVPPGASLKALVGLIHVTHGKVPCRPVDPRLRPRSLWWKRTYFDGYNFILHIPVDGGPRVQQVVQVRVPQTTAHPDMRTPVRLPAGADVALEDRFDGLTLPEPTVASTRHAYPLGDGARLVERIRVNPWGDVAVHTRAGMKGRTGMPVHEDPVGEGLYRGQVRLEGFP